jgi:hypothetical protein
MDLKPPPLSWAHRRKSLEPIQSMLPIATMKKDRSLSDVPQSPNRIKLDPLHSPRNISPEVPCSIPLQLFRHDLSPLSPRLEASGKAVLPAISGREEGICIVPPSDLHQPRRGSISDIHTTTSHFAALSASPKTPLNRLTPLPSPRLPQPDSPSTDSWRGKLTDTTCFVFPPLEGDEEEELKRLCAN